MDWGLSGLQSLDPSARGARIRSLWVYEGFNASGGILPSVYTENFVTDNRIVAASVKF